MSNYTVLWAKQEPGDLSPVQERKDFDSQYQANWFANYLKKSYNWVICVESKNLKEY
jgi:hypothetical protein|tara:strand:+ start:59 stop:229 length:171 start_codon:yes stop_codon:yes gene_type:complete